MEKGKEREKRKERKRKGKNTVQGQPFNKAIGSRPLWALWIVHNIAIATGAVRRSGVVAFSEISQEPCKISWTAHEVSPKATAM